MKLSRQNIAVLFADICSSTSLYEKAGDSQALTITASCIDDMKRCIQAQKGKIIDVRGDGILATFATAEAALIASQAIRESTFTKQLSVHAGIHWGTTLQTETSIFGDTVNVASRMADLAKANEIILSKDAYDTLPNWLHIGIRNLGPVVVKGKTELMTVFLSANTGPDETVFGKGMVLTVPAPIILLELTYGNRTIQFRDATGSLVIGRNIDCGLIVDDQVVSRRHATIESKQSKFFISDHSSNGTYVLVEGGNSTFLRRDTMQLTGQGYLSCGIETDRNLFHRIQFSVIDG
jgi:adenylate cyclase